MYLYITALDDSMFTLHDGTGTRTHNHDILRGIQRSKTNDVLTQQRCSDLNPKL